MYLLEAESRYACVYRLRRRLRQCGLVSDALVRATLEFLAGEFRIAKAAVHVLAERGEILREVYRLDHDGQIQRGEREEPLWDGSAAHEVLFGAKGIEILPIPESEGAWQTMMIRIGPSGVSDSPAAAEETQDTLSQPPYGILEMTAGQETDLEILAGCAEELGEWLELSSLQERLSQQSSHIESFSELSWLFVTSLRLEDRLRLILEGIQKLFEFDRLRLYLLDPSGTQLKGEIEALINRQVRSLDQERYPLAAGESRSLCEVLWKTLRQDPWSRILEQSLASHEKILYLPLKIQTKEIGVLVVDNLLSQEPIAKETRALLQSFAGQIALAVDNARLFSEVERLSLYDTLSRLPNRRYFEQRFEEELYRAFRHKTSFALCLMDLDFFKEINDTYGHQMGDRVIQAAGGAINSVIRQSDFAARWGGDEIVILLGDTHEQDAIIVIERIMTALRELRLTYPADPPKEVRITASMGVAFYPNDGQNLESLMANADRALYHIKFRGRNGFSLVSQLGEPPTAEPDTPATPS